MQCIIMLRIQLYKTALNKFKLLKFNDCSRLFKQTLNIGYNQVLNLVRQLPKNEVDRLISDVEKTETSNGKATIPASNFKSEEQFLEGFGMFKEQPIDFKEIRKNAWRNAQ